MPIHQQHAWNRGGVWDAYFAVVLAATLVIVLATQATAAAHVVAGVSLLATVPLYILVGRPAIAADRDIRRGTIYVICRPRPRSCCCGPARRRLPMSVSTPAPGTSV
jgi:hypothetical protein